MGLELLSLSLYTLVAFDRNRPEASEAAMKYFVLGAVASGFLLYGFSMLYGITGSLQIAEISSKLTDASINPVVLSFALVFVVVGIAFKFGAAPFQYGCLTCIREQQLPLPCLLVRYQNLHLWLC